MQTRVRSSVLGVFGAWLLFSHTAPVPTRYITVAANERIAVSLHHPSVPDESLVPVVLLPGVLGSSFSMRHVTNGLLDLGHEVVVIDPLGMGASDRPPVSAYSLDAQARRVLAVLDTIGWRNVVIAGHGTSATIALRAAAISPLGVRGVVSIAGGPVDAQNTGGVQTVMRFARVLDTPIGRSLGRRRFTEQLRARSASHAWVTDSVVRMYLRPIDSDLRGSLRAMQAMSTSVEPTAVRDVLRAVRAPVTVLVGERRTEGSPSAAQLAMLSLLAGAVRVDTIAGAGSMLHEEAPSAVSQAIVRHTRRGVAGGVDDR